MSDVWCCARAEATKGEDCSCGRRLVEYADLQTVLRCIRRMRPTPTVAVPQPSATPTWRRCKDNDTNYHPAGALHLFGRQAAAPRLAATSQAAMSDTDGWSD